MFGINNFKAFHSFYRCQYRTQEVIIGSDNLKILKSIYVYMPNKNINITSSLRYDIKIINALDK